MSVSWVRLKLQNFFYYVAGLIFLALVKVKCALRGYATPRPFSIREVDRCVDYDIHVASKWISYLEAYTKQKAFFEGKSVLELCPGDDLGTGLYLIWKGVDHYTAVDVNMLALDTSNPLYDRMLDKLSTLDSSGYTCRAATEIDALKRGTSGSISYIVRPDFDISAAIAPNSTDLIFSQAAFEHFDNVAKTIQQISMVARSGAVAVLEIDLATHSRWIRDKDPLNIYRYSDRIYSFFSTKGSPNRVRPAFYREMFEREGWRSVEVVVLSEVPLDKLSRVAPGLDRRFAKDIEAMPALSIMLCATRV